MKSQPIACFSILLFLSWNIGRLKWAQGFLLPSRCRSTVVGSTTGLRYGSGSGSRWDNDDFRQTPSRPPGDYPMSYSRSYFDDPGGFDEDPQPPMYNYPRFYPDSDYAYRDAYGYSQTRASSTTGMDQSSNSWRRSYDNQDGYYDESPQQPLYESSSSWDATGRSLTDDDTTEEFWYDKDRMAAPWRRNTIHRVTRGAISSSFYSSPLQLPSLFGTLLGSSPLFGSLRSIRSSLIMMMQDQQQDDRMQVESLLEQASEALNSDPTCTTLLGREIWISQVLSKYCSQQQSSEFWSHHHQDGRQDYFQQQQRIIQLQVRVQGPRTGATASVWGVTNDNDDDGDGGVMMMMMEGIILQFDDGEEYSVPIVRPAGRGAQWKTEAPRSSTPLSDSLRTAAQRKMKSWNSRSSAPEMESDVVDVEIVEQRYEDKDGDTSRQPWKTRHRHSRRYSPFS